MTVRLAAILLASVALTDIKELAAAPEDEPLSDRVANYRIEVEAEPEAKRLAGTEALTWRNRGELPVSELYFHLYPNAFKSLRTTFMREYSPSDPGLDADALGKIEIASICDDDGEDLTPTMQFVQPDDDNPDDETLMKLPLPYAVQPGNFVKLQLRFAVTLPALYRRMGIADDFIMGAQWFPKMAAYETAGMRGRTQEGWNLHQYHANSEFYADFGEYDVAIHTPLSYQIAASGRKLHDKRLQNGCREHRFRAADVHDFAWAASPHFIERERKTERGVTVRLFLDPRHEALQERYLRAASSILDFYHDWFGPYPYPEISIVVPPERAKGAGSMEYPTLVTVAPAAEANPGLNLERVMAHELAHQYWYGIVANNEFEEAWLDEGFASYAEEKAMQELFAVDTKIWYRPYSQTYNFLKKPGWQYLDRMDYVNNVYIGGKHVLQDVESQIGEACMKRLLQTYRYRWQFRHPGTQDFIDVLEEVTERSWKDYFAAVHAVATVEPGDAV